ncbi:MAG TPA: hypothetical protein VER32_16190 [Pyrinomonadaceae bacterium]|nr:hypothetical protein [Pyrinomonadaceae bacterium]
MNLVESLYACPCRGVIALITGLVFVYFSSVLFPAVTKRYQTEGERFLALQRSYQVDDFRETLKRWSAGEGGGRGVEIFKRENLVNIDLAYPLVYACFFAFAYAWARGNARPGGWDYLFFLMPFAAALLDYFENGLHLHLLRGVNTRADVESATFSPALVFAASAFAHAKMFLFAVGSLAWPVAFLLRLFR